MEQKHKVYLAIKYALDKFFAILCLLVLSPVFLITTIIIAIDSRGKIIFRQEREGKNRQVVFIYKFRTMVSTDVPFNKKRQLIASDDQNVTRVGRFLRKTKIDELPQLLNIIRGDMSFIGPRPLMPVYSLSYEKWEYYKFSGKPGMTGLAQVNGNGVLSVQGRSYYDVLYNEKVSFLLDVKIFFKTIYVILRGEEKTLNEPKKEQIDEMRKRYDA